MFHWICPECGREIPPVMKECPACDPKAVVAQPAALAVTEALPVVAEAAPPVQVEPPAVEVPVAAMAVAEPLPEPESPPDPILALAEQIRAVQVQALAPATPEPDPPKPEAPKQETARPEPPAPTALPGLGKLATAVGLSEASQVEPETSLPVAQNLQPVALLAPPSEPPPQLQEAEAPAAPQAPLLAVQPPAPEVKPPSPEPEIPALVAAGMSAPLTAEAAPAPVQQLVPPPVVKDMTVSSPGSVDKPPSGSWLQLAPLQDYAAAATRAMQPAAPPAQILTPDSGPRMTLPGPALPPELARLQDATIVTVIGESRAARKTGMPGWLVSLMLMVGIPIVGASILFYFQPLGHSSADAKPLPAETTAAAAVVTQPASTPLAQFIEVTGFRFVVDPNKKSEIHYLVVNHSPAELSDVTVFVTLRAGGAKTGQPPLCRFSFRAPSLSAFESKEMTSPIEKLSKAISLPEWQDLRSEIQIAQ
jgi:hypothetical protein